MTNTKTKTTKTNITKTTLPVTSLLNQPDQKYDYIDCFQSIIIDNENKLQSTEICTAFFSSDPKWVKKMMGLRNKIVAMFGLKTSASKISRKQVLENFKCEPGDQVGIFKVFAKTDNEVIIGEDDKHLDFRVSLFLDHNLDQNQEIGIEKQLTVSTVVIFKNLFGRIYFFLIKPFHKLVVAAKIKSMIQTINTSKAIR